MLPCSYLPIVILGGYSTYGLKKVTNLFEGRISNMTLERVIFANDHIDRMLLFDKLYHFHYEEWCVFNAIVTEKAYIVLRDKQVVNIITP